MVSFARGINRDTNVDTRFDRERIAHPFHS
jgi:hypothetical protein